MALDQNAFYPIHLAELVARRLDSHGTVGPSEQILLQLFETLYFASLKTDEARPCRCTVNYIDPNCGGSDLPGSHRDSDWQVIRFREPLPLSVRTLIKLADAADPTVSSLAVYSHHDQGLFIWGIVDQELRYGDYVALDAKGDPQRPGLFQATITGVGSVAVYQNFALLGSLEQNNLVNEYYNVLWQGPVHQHLRNTLQETLVDHQESHKEPRKLSHVAHIMEELLVRWENAICRILVNIQQYNHGGGLLIVPKCPAPDVDVKYEQVYDRLPTSLFRLAEQQMLKRQMADTIAAHCRHADDTLPCAVHFDAVTYQTELDRLKSILLGCVRYIASLSRVDGFVLLDQSLVVHGFGVEARADTDLCEIFIAGDAQASSHLLRTAPLSQFGTRHRAMMRYCDANPGSLGFVISQDGDIRATMQHNGRLLLWENINVQLAYRAENRGPIMANFSPQMMTGLFQHWLNSVTSVHCQ